MNDTIAAVRAWWAGLDTTKRRYVRIGLVVACVIVLALLGNCSG